MGHKEPVERPRCIAAVRSRTQVQSINQSIRVTGYVPVAGHFQYVR